LRLVLVTAVPTFLTHGIGTLLRIIVGFMFWPGSGMGLFVLETVIRQGGKKHIHGRVEAGSNVRHGW